MYTFEPGKISEIFRGAYKPYKRCTRSWRILDPSSEVVAETTTKYGALAIVTLLNSR